LFLNSDFLIIRYGILNPLFFILKICLLCLIDLFHVKCLSVIVLNYLFSLYKHCEIWFILVGVQRECLTVFLMFAHALCTLRAQMLRCRIELLGYGRGNGSFLTFIESFVIIVILYNITR
jgi:hypothetical protein